jgi:hypothetical protein
MGQEGGAWLAGKNSSGYRLRPGIPKALHRKLRLHCVYEEIPLMDFVCKALEEKLARARVAPATVRRKLA